MTMKRNWITERLKDLYSLEDLRSFLSESGRWHNKGYFQYTTAAAVEGMRKSGQIWLAAGSEMNDLDEISTYAPERWQRMYVASFSASTHESIAMWAIYGSLPREAVRVQFRQQDICAVVDKARSEGCVAEVGSDGELLDNKFKIKSIELIDVVYRRKNSLALRATTVRDEFFRKESFERRLNILAGCIKDYAWEYEYEVRILLELADDIPSNILPARVALSATAMMENLKVMTGPCCDDRMVKEKIGDVEMRNSGLYGKVKVKSLCKYCPCVDMNSCPASMRSKEKMTRMEEDFVQKRREEEWWKMKH